MTQMPSAVGWTPTEELDPGDLLATHDGRWIPIAARQATGHAAPVYNLRIADYHTYVVGSPAWGFSVRVHNPYNALSAVPTAALHADDVAT